LLLAAPANAAFLTFVSATGNDANPCTVQANPCKTLQRAINQTSLGGEILILSNLPAQSPTVATSLTIDGGNKTMIGTITINSASAIVALRDLGLTGRGAVANGVNIVNAAAVHVEHCTMERYTADGITIAANAATELSVSDSTIADNGSDGVSVLSPSTAKLMIVDSVLANNSNGLSLQGGFAAVVRSVASGNGGGGLFVVGATLVARDVTLASNGENLNVGSGGVATLKSVTLRDAGNTASSIFVGSGGLVRLATSVLTNNAVAIDNGGTVQTLDDNILDGNGTDVSGTALDSTVNYQ
jgi:hypothetical protein